MSVCKKIKLFFKKIWLFLRSLLFCKICKKIKRKSVVINNDSYIEFDDISTFDLENHNHIFKSQKPKQKKYQPPKITEVNELDFSYRSSSDDELFESAIEF